MFYFSQTPVRVAVLAILGYSATAITNSALVYAQTNQNELASTLKRPTATDNPSASNGLSVLSSDLTNTSLKLKREATVQETLTMTPDVQGTYLISNAITPSVSAALRESVTVVAQALAPTNASDAKTATLQTIEVTVERLKAARIELSPQVGTTIYTVDQGLIDSLGKGSATTVDEVLLRLPGVSKDSKASGSLHVRDDHGNVQYRIDGIQLPEAISGFGLSFDTRFIDKIDFLTGALPAQYGLRTAGIVDIQSKLGSATPGGRVGVLLGSNNTLEPSAEIFGSSGRLSYYLTGSYTANGIGIENPLPTRTAEHDKTRQSKAFGNFSYFLDDETRVGLIFGTYNGRFQIPTNPGQTAGFSLGGFSDTVAGTNSYPSSQVDERQTEVNRFAALSFQKTSGRFDYQLSAFHQYSNLHFTPDPIGDLIFNGVASDTLRSNSSNGLQADAAYRLNPEHTLRFGGQYTRQTTQSNNAVSAFSVDTTGAQISNVPLVINDNSSKVGRLSSIYVQDEWHLNPKLTLNYGLRFDHVSAFTDEHQWSPRLNLAYSINADTAVHAGYSRYFTPPPQELASQKSIDLYASTTNQPQVATSNNVKAERTNYFDIGVSRKLSPHLTIAADAYYKQIRNLIDEGQFGQALILSPYNYERGYARGLELSSNYNDSHWGAYLNLTYQKAQGRNITSGESLFSPDKLAFIAQNFIYLDHDQTYTASGGISYKFGQSRIGGDFLYGSGLRRTSTGGPPNGAALRHYTIANATASHTLRSGPTSAVEVRIALLNLFDRSYQLRDGSGVGVGAPQFALRRSLFLGLATSF